MRIAFVYIAEAYQLYHAAAVMFELMQRPDVEVDIYHIDETVPAHLDLLAEAHSVAPVESSQLRAGLLGRSIQNLRIFGLAKPQVLATNEDMLGKYDAVVSTEDGITRLFRDNDTKSRPARILITHGAGTRHVPSIANRADCDLILAKGEKDVANYVRTGHIHADRMIAAGYPKLHTTSLLARNAEPIFRNTNKTVLYNPHKDRKERSWDRFFHPLMEGFRTDRSRNLIVAPHVKMFRRRSERLRQKLRAMTEETIIVDPASSRLLDNSYTEAADIYVGDVSSQVVEFIARPRPCVFLNAHGVDWQDDPHYAMWHLGEVVDEPAKLMSAIDRAPRVHERYAQKQAEFAASALGDTSQDAVAASADAIVTFVREWKSQ